MKAKMKIQRLSWAGLKIESNGQILLIDAVENYQGGSAAIGPEHPYIFSDHTRADVILLTHLHSDHYDKDLIHVALKSDGKLFSSDQITTELITDGLNPTGLALGVAHIIGNFTITPVFGMDGIGDKQVSWVVEDAQHRILHGGDTIWHNQFWQIGRTFERFDAVFLPINGVVLNIPRLEFSPVPITLTPFQAVAAARLLQAGTLVPIHYGFNRPGTYDQYPGMEEELNQSAKQQRLEVTWLEPGEFIQLPEISR
jgi:L-ascorbate metabolism protein UlaG (beta-lactamase superfamily)